MTRRSPSIPSFSENCDAEFSSFHRGKKRATLQRWFDGGVGRLPLDADTGLKWADLLARLRRTGHAMPVKDGLIAAIALAHNLAISTRNRADFVNAGVRVVDPFVA